VSGGSPSICSDHVNRHDAQRKVTMVSERTSRTVSRAPHVGSGHFTWKAAATLGVGGGDSGCMVDGSYSVPDGKTVQTGTLVSRFVKGIITSRRRGPRKAAKNR
jgi:hypothetical protein